MTVLGRWLGRPPRRLPGPRSLLWPLTAALLLRLATIASDLPDTLVLDEWDYLTRAYGLFGGHFDPHWHLNPPGFLWGQALALLPVAAWEWVRGGIEAVRLLYTTDKTPFLLSGRLLSAACGVWAVLQVRDLAKGWGGPRAGRLAAWILALTPAAVEVSQRAKPDALALTLSLACLLSLQRGRPVRAALWAGLAAATKRPAGLLLLPLLLCMHKREKGVPVKAALAGAGAFLLVDPWILLKPAEYFRDLGAASLLWAERPDGVLLPSLLSVPVVLWIGLAAGRIPRAALPALLLGAAYWAAFGVRDGIFRPDLLLPGTAALAAVSAAALARRIPPVRWAWGILLAAAALLPHGWGLAQRIRLRLAPTTLARYRDWALATLPDGTRLAADSLTDYLPNADDPAFRDGRNGDLLEALRRANVGKCFVIRPCNQVSGQPLEELRRQGVRYVVSNSVVRRDTSRTEAEQAFFRDLDRLPVVYEDPGVGRAGPAIRVYELPP